MNRTNTIGLRLGMMIGAADPDALRLIHVASATDHRMVEAVRVLALSLAKQATGARPIVFHIATDCAALVRQVLEGVRSDSFRVEVIPFAAETQTLKAEPPYCRAIYQRLHLDVLIPGASRIIYLDADTVALKAMGPLYDTGLLGHPIAAVPDYALRHFELLSFIPFEGGWGPTQVYLRRRLSIDYRCAEDYFNSGVLVFDLDLWRSERLGKTVTDWISARERLQWPDQDGLNAVIGQDYARLDPRWNVHAQWCDHDSRHDFGGEWPTIRRAWEDEPWIVHFAGACKPWRSDHTRTRHDHHYREAADTP